MLSQLVSKMDNLEKTLREHTTILTKSSQLNTNHTATHKDGRNSSHTDRKQTYAETLVKGIAQSTTQQTASQALPPAPSLHSQVAPQGQGQSQDYRMMVREELLELDERKK